MMVYGDEDGVEMMVSGDDQGVEIMVSGDEEARSQIYTVQSCITKQ